LRQPVTVLFHDRSRRRQPDPPGSFEVIIKTLGGIAGTLAVFSALLSVFGFLLLRSHSNLLGLSNFLGHSVTDYFYEGSGFAGYTLLSVFELLVRHIYLLALAAAIFVAAKLLSRHVRFGARFPRFAGGSASGRRLLAWIFVVVAATSVLYFIHQSVPASQANDLLFSSGDQDEKLKRTDGKLKELEATYTNALTYFLLSVAVIWSAYSILPRADADERPLTPGADEGARAGRKPLPKRAGGDLSLSLGLAFLTFLVIFQLLLLPGIYGQTIYSNNFHKVVTEGLIMGDTLKVIPESKSVWLIKENPEYFILYFGDEDMLRLVRKDEVKNLSLGGRENIFGR
jgi:hypothetical protein